MNCGCRIANGKASFCPEHWTRLLRLPVDQTFAALARALSGDFAALGGMR